MGRVILVSNRLPVGVRRVGEHVQVEPAVAGGLVAGLGPVHREGNGLWFGTLAEASEPDVQRELERQRLVAVPVSEEDAERHYGGYSNSVLWPLFHYLQDRVELTSQDFEAYERVNEQFADEIAARARPDDQIWIHDYHFMLLPAMLRERLPAAPIGFFLHIPFPSSEVFRLLPQRQRILKGLLGANLIGVHTFDYARHLVSSCRRALGVEFDQNWVTETGHRCRVGVFPMGIDVVGFRERVASPRVPRYIERFRSQLEGRLIVLGVDRLDYTKGLPLKLEAYRRLLETEPIWRTEAVFVQIANPTRSDIDTYKRLKQQVEQMVGEINGAFETEGRVPIHYLYRSFSPEALAAYYQMADVALVTPLRDGMNLVAKEYVSCRTEDTGVLVLSEFAGAASEMGEAIQVNPWDIDGCARGIHQALCMPVTEQNHRMRDLRRRIEALDVRNWAPTFLSSLDVVHRASFAEAAVEGDVPWTQALQEAFLQARRRLLVLDHDGTLAPLAPSPHLAAPRPGLLETLESLVSHPDVEIAVVTGRDRQTMEDWFGRLPLSLIGEHGFEFRLSGRQDWEVLLPNADFAWMESVRTILDEYAARTSGAFVERKRSSLAWHYRQVEPGFGSWQARELASHLIEAFSHSPVVVIHGAKVVEVRHQGIDKGAALTHLIRERGPFDFVLLAGDDRTDEDMFQMAPAGAWSVKVGRGASRARFRLLRPSGVRQMLGDLASIRERADGPDTPDVGPEAADGGGRTETGSRPG
jgi:trehalose 6-phosphate synthase/phosphatase